MKQKYGNQAIPLLDRLHMMRGLSLVEWVGGFEEATPVNLILEVRPRLYVRGPDYYGVQLPEQQALDEVGATLLIHQVEKRYSASLLSNVSDKA